MASRIRSRTSSGHRPNHTSGVSLDQPAGDGVVHQKKSSGRGLGLRNITNMVNRGRDPTVGAKKSRGLSRSGTVAPTSHHQPHSHATSSSHTRQLARGSTVPTQQQCDVSKALVFRDHDVAMRGAPRSAAGSGHATISTDPFTDVYVDDDDLDESSDEDMGGIDDDAAGDARVAPDPAPTGGSGSAGVGEHKAGMVPASDPINPSVFNSALSLTVQQAAQGAGAGSDVAALRAQLARVQAENEELREIVERHAPKHVEISSEVYSVRNHTVTPMKLERSLSIHTAAVLARTMPRPKRSELVKNMVTLFSHRQGFEQYVTTRSFAQDLCTLARLAASALAKEERLLSLSSPIYIFGDIHGNLKDLHFFSDNLWKFGVHLTAGRFLFLGDYVDRGQQSLEVVAYLLALKLSAPEKFFLLRGNHELRKVNGWEEWYKAGSFLWQCKHRFGDTVGTQVWEEVNKAFDCMPLAAVVDDSIFCCHGGIPRPLPGMTHSPPAPAQTRTPLRDAGRRSSSGSRRSSIGSTDSGLLGSPGASVSSPRRTSLLETPRPGRPSRRHHDRRLDAIRAVPCPISLEDVDEAELSHAATASAERAAGELSSELVTRVALDMLWADPAADESEPDLGADGFGPGLRGGDTVQYGNTAIDEFLDGNGLQLIVRAHQAISTGIGISKSAKVFTVFSTSKDHGCGSQATCGCLLVENGKVLPIMRAPQKPGHHHRATVHSRVTKPEHGHIGPQPGASREEQEAVRQHHSGPRYTQTQPPGLPRAQHGHSSHQAVGAVHTSRGHHSASAGRRLQRSSTVQTIPEGFQQPTGAAGGSSRDGHAPR